MLNGGKRMTRTRITLGIAAITLLLAACSDETTGTPAGEPTLSATLTPSETMASPTPSPTKTKSDSKSGATVETAKVQGLGTVLVNEDGLTLYLFTNDTGTKSTCTGTCAQTWPGLTTDGQPVAGSGADDGKLGTTGSGGDQQVTYEEHPLYLYSGDSKAGEANGQGIGGIWFAVTPDGAAAG
jgi:predicted lipoprotein with Yx(FWY)xxD motif